MSVYKLFAGTTGGTESSLASVDIQFAGDIVAISVAATHDADADGEQHSVEVSFLSSATFAVNDARGSLLIAGSKMHLTTSGGVNTAYNHSANGLRVPVNQGERVHVHCSSTAGVVGQFHVYLYVNDAADEQLRRRR